MGVPDTTNVKKREFPPIKPDWYDVIFDSFEEKVDKNKDDYTLAIFKPVDSDREIWCNISHQDEFLWKVKEFKQAIGMADSAIDLTPYIGTRLKVFIKNRVAKNKDGEDTNYPDIRKFKVMDYGKEQAPQKGSDGLPWD